MSKLGDMSIDELNAKETVLRMAKSRSDEELLSLQRRGLELLRSPKTRGRFNNIGVASSLNTLGKRPRRLQLSAFMRELQVRGVDVTDAMNAQEVAICLNALGKVRDVNSAFLNLLQRRGLEVADTMNAQNVANCLNALSKVKSVNTVFVDSLQRRGLEVADTMNAQEVANCLNALSKVKSVNTVFLDSLQRRGLEVADTMSAQGVANCLNALSKVESVNTVFVDSLQRRGLKVADTMNAQNVANCLNALCYPDRLHLADMSFVRLLQKRVEVVHAMSAQEVSSSLYALQWIKDADHAFVHELQKRGVAVVEDMDSLAITNCLFAMSKFDTSWQDVAFMEVLQLRTLDSDTVAGMNSKATVKSLHALSRLDRDILHDDAVTVLESRAEATVDDMNETSIGMRRRALKSLGRAGDPRGASSDAPSTHASKRADPEQQRQPGSVLQRAASRNVQTKRSPSGEVRDGSRRRQRR